MRPPRNAGAQEWLYLIIVAALAAYFVIGLLAWAWMLVVGVAAPDAFTTILAAIAGAFAGILSPLQGPRTGRSGGTGAATDPEPRGGA